jgi:hypothetical protein
MLRGRCDRSWIELKETSAEVFSVIVVKRQTKKIGTHTQFGHSGCQEAQHILKRALLSRCQHDLESYVIFIDLVNAFDTVNHDLLHAILDRYGFPPSLVQNIAKLYKNCAVRIKVGKDFAEVDYTVGVHQGDNMSQVLFLFIIQAFLDTFRLKTQPVKIACFSENNNGKTKTSKGRLINQNTKRCHI